MELAAKFQTLDKGVHVSLHVNIFGKGLHSSVLLPDIGK